VTDQRQLSMPIERVEAAQARAVTRMIHRTFITAAEVHPEASIEALCAICLYAHEGTIAYELKEARLRVIEEIRTRLNEDE
jgi:hypothetical protein